MKYTKKLFALTVALILALALAAPTFAAGTGSITIDNPVLGETYNAYKVFDATIAKDTSGKTIGTSYTIKTSDAWYGIVSAATDVFQLDLVGGTTDTYYVTVKSGVSDDTVISTLLPKVEGVVQLPASALTIGEKIPNEDNPAVVWDNVAYGYYVVTSSLGAAVSVNSANPDVVIFDKNQDGPGWDPDGGKLASTNGTNYSDEISLNYGGTVYYKISVDATNYNGEEKIRSYTIYDDMADGLSMKSGTLVVKVGTETLTLDEDYTVAYNGKDGNEKDYSMAITIPWVNAENNSLYASEATIEVTYQATVDEDAVIGDAGNKNEAWFTYKDSEGDQPGTPSTDDAIVYTYALSIKKVDGTDGTTPLAGATFALTLDGANVPVSKISDGVYKYDETSGSNEVVTPADGVVVIKGLKNGTYTLTETKAPEGYNLLEEPESIVAEKASAQKVTYYYDATGKLIGTEPGDVVDYTTVQSIGLTVENNRGGLLPSTGGMGTTIFYTMGGLLVVGAAVLLVTKKRVHDMEA